MKYYLGLDIGGTKCAVSLGVNGLSREGLEFEKEVFQTNGSPQSVVERTYTIMENLIAKKNVTLSEVAGIGISCGGPLDAVSGRILSPPNLYGWNDVPIVDMFEERFGIKTRVENDANACALAEWRYGAAKGHSNAVFLTFGTGLGAGMILNNRLYRGANNMAGEVGHIRLSKNGPVGFGKSGSFEGFCSGSGIAQIAKQKVMERIQQGESPKLCPDLTAIDSLTAKTVGDAAEAGDSLAREIFAYCGEYLGRGLSLIVDILNPEVIVLGSVFARCEHFLRPTMLDVLEREALSSSLSICKIVASGLGDNIGDYAALSVAINDLS